MAEVLNAIPNVIYDFICRIIPGALLLHIFNPAMVKDHNSFFSNLLLLTAVWGIGFVLETTTGNLGKHMPYGAGSLKRGVRVREFDGSVFQLPGAWRSGLIRLTAERSFFRVMGLITAFIIMVRLAEPKYDIINAPPEWVGTTPIYWFFAAGLAFSWCWWQRGRDLNLQYARAEQWLKSNATGVAKSDKE